MKSFKTFLVSLLIGALLWGVVNLFLSHTPTLYSKVKRYYNFYIIKLERLFFEGKVVKKRVVAEKLNIKLKAIYGDSKSGFIIIEDKGKSVFVDLNGLYKGYKLTDIRRESVIFEKNSKRYIVEFDKINSDKYIIKEKREKIAVKRDTFKEYKNNLSKVWQNIHIQKSKEGYKILFVRLGSIFDKIGLKRGDVILRVNNRDLLNDADAWDIYKNADSFREFEIVIKRNNKEKVLYYEID